MIIKNLPLNITEPELINLTSQFGKIQSLKLNKKSVYNEMRAFAYVAFHDEHVAARLIEGLDGQDFQGQALSAELYKSAQKRYQEWSESKTGKLYGEIEEDFGRLKELLAKCIATNDQSLAP